MWISPDGEIPVEISCGPWPCFRISSAISSAQCVSRTWTALRGSMVHVRETHWADEIADEILKQGQGPHEISTGISPSGEIHIGNLREVITADVIYRVLT